MCSPPSPTRSRTRGHRTATAPMPVTISRSGRCPWRTSRRRPSSVNLSVWVLSQAATSASTACPNSVLAPLRKTSVSGSENVPGWVSSKTLVSVTAYHSFGGEVEALNTPTIRRLTPSCRHQLSALAPSLSRPVSSKLISKFKYTPSNSEKGNNCQPVVKVRHVSSDARRMVSVTATGRVLWAGQSAA